MAAFELPIRVYWEDTDAGGIVYYANYLKFFERARTEWLRQLGLAQQALREQTGGMFVVVQARLDYHQPARLDDELIVSVQLQDCGRAALTLAQQVWCVQPTPGTVARQLLCEGTIRLGWVNAAALKPARIPAAILSRLNS